MIRPDLGGQTEQKASETNEMVVQPRAPFVLSAERVSAFTANGC